MIIIVYKLRENREIERIVLSQKDNLVFPFKIKYKISSESGFKKRSR